MAVDEVVVAAVAAAQVTLTKEDATAMVALAASVGPCGGGGGVGASSGRSSP